MRKAKAYRQAAADLRKRGDKAQAALHQEMYIVHRCLGYGQTVLSLNKAMELGGVKPNGHPLFAVANASARWVWFVRDAGWIHDPNGLWRHPASAFISDWSTNPGWDTKRHIGKSKNHNFRFVRAHFPTAMLEERITGRVPIVPPSCLPPGHLSDYTILWEAAWQAAPKDPFLLKRVSREWYVVLAQWDLTEAERLVLEMAAFAGE